MAGRKNPKDASLHQFVLCLVGLTLRQVCKGLHFRDNCAKLFYSVVSSVVLIRDKYAYKSVHFPGNTFLLPGKGTKHGFESCITLWNV